MAANPQAPRMVELDVSEPIWDSFFHVAPLVLVGTLEEDGSPNLAPKHLAGPMGWTNLFGFVCAPSHRTYQNIERSGVFSVSYLRPDDVLLASLAAAPRLDDTSKPALDFLPTRATSAIDGVFLEGAALCLECTLERAVDDLDQNSLVIGRIKAARVDSLARRDPDRDDADVLADSPILAYLPPSFFTTISSGNSFPFHAGWRR